MARPREFDEETVLEAAVQCFWERGYEATSVRDLAKGMGITGASLYNAFGDKRSLYRRALEHYVRHSFEDRVGRFEGRLPPQEALSAFFAEIVERSLGDPKRKGCLLVNSALELAPHDPEFQGVIAEVLIQVEGFFRRCAEAGQKDGTVTTRQSPDDIACLLLGAFLGLRVLARARPEADLLKGLVGSTMALLSNEAAPPSRFRSA